MDIQSLSERLKSLSPEITRPLSCEEIVESLKVMGRLRKDPEYDILIKEFLSAYKDGGDFWQWGVEHFEHAPGRHGYSYGWWIVRGDQIVASVCHSYS